MNFGRLLVIFVDRRVLWQPSSLDFGGLRLRLSLGLLRLIFPLALSFLWLTLIVDLLRVSTCFSPFRTSLGLFSLSLTLGFGRDFSRWAYIFRMLGAYVDSLPGTLIPAVWVNYRRWTSLSLSALWSFIPASPVGSSYMGISVPVGSSLSLNVVALPTTYLL